VTLAELQATASAIVLELNRAKPEERRALLDARLGALQPMERSLAAAWCGAEAATWASDRDMNRRADVWILFGSACLFLIGFMAIALLVPNPTDFQRQTFRIILSLAAAAFGQAIPGVLLVEAHIGGKYGKWLIRAGGACAFFVVVYFWNPAGAGAPRMSR
jgi:hypothetical protein